MAFREVTMLEVKEILRLWLLGAAKKQIATQLGFDVKTVRRYLAVARARGVEASHGLAALDDELVGTVVAATQPATGRPRGEGWAACEAHREFIAGHVAHRVRLTKIGELLRRRGVAIECPTLRRFALAELGFGHGAPTVPVVDDRGAHRERTVVAGACSRDEDRRRACRARMHGRPARRGDADRSRRRGCRRAPSAPDAATCWRPGLPRPSPTWLRSER